MSITETAASVAARAFFYPSLAWNIARNRLQDTWHWWDEITPNVVLGAIPFYSTLDELKKLGVQAVVTLNETFEVFITTEQYQDSGFQHLHIPTVDFLYAPPTEDLHRGADFINDTAKDGGKTYVHCKAGRGRSTTLVLCYLIKYCSRTPEEAYTFVREKRPQVCLAQGQWTAVCGFYISCHPEKGLSIEDFPYPTLLPLAPGKQGSDGLESSLGSLEGVLDQSSQSEGRQAAGHTSDSKATEAPPTSHRESSADSLLLGPASPETTTSGGSEEVREVQNAAQQRHTAAGQGQQRINQAHSRSEEAEDVVVLNSAGSTVGSVSSDASLGSIATVLSSCCIHPRGQWLTASQSAEQASEVCPPRSASPAIEIPKSQPSENKQLPDSVPSPSPGSKASITLEPSGSLPGYIRIAPGLPKARTEDALMQAAYTSTGFVPIDEWADLGYQPAKE